jgi:parallel beta-helix repeat protein
LLIALSGVANASQLYVNETGWWHEGGAFTPDSTPIQSAVNGADAGDSIFVYGGSYTENVDVDRTLTLEGEGADVVTVTAESASDHVFEVTADRVNISGFNVTRMTGWSNAAGVHLHGADHCNISGNNASENQYGIYLEDSSNNTLTANNCSNNYYGIYLRSSCDDVLTANNCSDNSEGIRLAFSSNSTLQGNAMSGNMRNFYVRGNRYASLSHYAHNIDTSNTVNERPIYYWVDQQDREIPNDAGFVGVVNSTNITVRDLVLTENWHGVIFAYTDDSKIENVTLSDNRYGIYLLQSSNNTLCDNNASENYYGIFIEYSSSNTLHGNTMSENSCNFGVEGDDLSYYTQNIDTSNIVDEKPVYYWVDQQDREIPDDAGFVGVVNSTNITVIDLTLANNVQKVLFAYTNDSRIENVTARSGDYGIYLWSSNSNVMQGNAAPDNWHGGIYLSSSSDNTLHENTASKNQYGGIVLGSSSNNNTLTRNNASNNMLRGGICLYSSSGNTMRENIISGNREAGIYLRYSSCDNEITCNLVCNNEERGFYLCWGSNTGNNISHNNIVENGNHNETSGGWEWQFYNDQPDDVDASDNWWGTGDEASIAAGIYDWNCDSGMGNVTCLPCLDAPSPCAPGTEEEPGGFTAADAVIALEIAAGSRPFDSRMDVDGDGSVTSLDALMILQAATVLR